MSNRVAVILAAIFIVLFVSAVCALVALPLVQHGHAHHQARRHVDTARTGQHPARAVPQEPAPAPAPAITLHLHPVSHKDRLQELTYVHFQVGYDNQRRNPAWVLYVLEGGISNPGHAARRPQRFATEMATSAQVRHEDYSHGGFDRGHMCPSYAMFSRYGVAGEDETFVMANVIPQIHSLNAGMWETLEEHQAGRWGAGNGWGGTCGSITIINGPVYIGQPHYLTSHVQVPDACFSMVFSSSLDHTHYQSMAFEMPNRDGVSGPLQRYLVSIRSIEEQTGLDVFDGQPADVRAELEDAVAPALWP